jgi:diguanylate cyclase (GGDEF)-like protein/PAS domain S-box-containing protein
MRPGQRASSGGRQGRPVRPARGAPCREGGRPLKPLDEASTRCLLEPDPNVADGAHRCGRHARGLALQIFESTAEGIIVTDRTGAIVQANPAFCAMTGYTREELLGQNPRIMKSDRHDAEFYRAMWLDLTTTGHWRGEVWDRRKNGEVYPKWMSIDVLRNADGEVTHYVGVSSDISRVKRTEAELERQAHYDELTGLPNRILFRDRLQQAMAHAQRQAAMAALLFLDLDGFKDVNNSFGHRAGDTLLAKVAERLVACVRASDTVGRFGGDEFAIVLPGLVDSSAAALVARKIRDAFQSPFMIDHQEAAVTTSIGIALYPQDGNVVDELLKSADTAMYHAKELGKNGHRFFSGALHAKALLRLELEADLKRAIEREEFLLHYQPKVDLRSGAITGVEALVRWQHPTQGLVPPARFIPIAEQTKLILPLGEWVLRTALKQQCAWLAAGYPLRMAVNLAAPQFEQADLANRIARALIDSVAQPDHLELELTESTAMANPDATTSVLLELKSIGVHVSIDDFGTGYSSLGYLKRFPIDALKIDRSFVRDLSSDPDDQTIARAIIGLSRSLGHTVIAEGVETKEQLRFLMQEGCDEVQGYLLSRPVAADALEKLLRQNRRMLPV